MKQPGQLFLSSSSCLIVLFWFAVILGMLYVPRLAIFPRAKTLNILSWGGIFDPATLADFTAATGIKVNVSFFSTNEELLVYLRTTQGRGYDLVVPSDYAVKQLRDEKLLKKIDKSRLTFLDSLNPNLLGYSFDVHNDYSLPYMVEVFGLSYDKEFFKGTLNPSSWDWIFRPHGFKIVMVNDPVEAVVLAAHYLYRPVPQSLSSQQITEVKDLLIAQRQWIEAYSDFRPDYFLLTKNCPLVVTAYSSYLRARQQSSDIGFAIPEEGTFMSIENISISAATHEDDAVYDFINYMYKADVLKHHFTTRSSVPATKDMLTELPVDKEISTILTQPRDAFIKNVMFFAPIMPERKLHKLWIAVKSQ